MQLVNFALVMHKPGRSLLVSVQPRALDSLLLLCLQCNHYMNLSESPLFCICLFEEDTAVLVLLLLLLLLLFSFLLRALMITRL